MPRTPGRGVSRAGLLSGLLVLAALAMVGALGYEAWRGARSHRATAVGLLRDHAAVAAWQYARESRIWLGFGMSQAGAALARAVASRGAGPLPGPELMSRVLAEKDCDCVSAGFASTLFRIVPGDPDPWRAAGRSLPPATVSALVGEARDDSAGRSGPRPWRILPPGTPGLAGPDDSILLWRIDQPGPGARPVHYGMVVEVAQIRRPLAGALGEAELLPPTLLPRPASDSVLQIRVTGPSGTPIASFGPSRPLEFPATDTVGVLYGDLRITAAILPEAAGRLIQGGVPATRIPQIAALLVVTFLLGALALLLVRREQRLARLRDDFVSGVSHELRTPLTQIRILGELLETGGFGSAGERERAIGIIHREALRLTNLVDNVLQFSRLRRRPPPPDAVPVTVDEVVAEVAETFRPFLALRGASLLTRNGAGAVALADRDSLARIVRNLLENALKYGPDGQAITVVVTTAGEAVRIAVEDQGPGIPPGERDRVFLPYYRLDRDRNSSGGGTGIGLAVVSELTEGHGGRAWVEEAPGGGARFVVELPRAAR